MTLPVRVKLWRLAIVTLGFVVISHYLDTGGPFAVWFSILFIAITIVFIIVGVADRRAARVEGK